LKIPITSSGIELATFQLVAQCLKNLRYDVLGNDGNKSKLYPQINLTSDQTRGYACYQLAQSSLCIPPFIHRTVNIELYILWFYLLLCVNIKFGVSHWERNMSDSFLQQNAKAYFESKDQEVTRGEGKIA
jgi:hypothetical protein